MLRKISFLLFLLFLISGCAGSKLITGKGKINKVILDSNLNKAHFLGIKVIDASTHEILTSYNSEKLFTPASNVKLLTFYITDKIIQDSIPSIKYCISNDSLYFTGMADPTFLHPKFQNQKAFQYLETSLKNLICVPQEMADERYGAGWAWDDYSYGFQVEKSTFPIYRNSIWVTKIELEERLNFTPNYFPINYLGYDSIKSGIYRDEMKNEFEWYSDSLSSVIDKTIPFRTSDSLTIKLLTDTIKSTISTGNFPSACELHTIFTYPKDSLFQRLLVNSDNFIADQLLLSSSYIMFNSFDSEKMREYGLSTFFPEWRNRIEWMDGSGLSRYNMMSPDFMVDVISKIYQENEWNRIILLFPDGGEEGTLNNFLHSNQTYVLAKSGSMTGVYNLSGFLITESGKTLIFSIMNNGFNLPMREIKAQVEEILLFLKEKY